MHTVAGNRAQRHITIWACFFNNLLGFSGFVRGGAQAHAPSGGPGLIEPVSEQVSTVFLVLPYHLKSGMLIRKSYVLVLLLPVLRTHMPAVFPVPTLQVVLLCCIILSVTGRCLFRSSGREREVGLLTLCCCSVVDGYTYGNYNGAVS